MNEKTKNEEIRTPKFVGKDGSYREEGKGEQLPTDFWDGAPTLTYNHQHVRVPELKGQVTYQYKLENGRLYVRTRQYMLTTRPTNKNWYRANINILVESNTSQRVNSPDTMSQDTQWHTYDAELTVNFAREIGGKISVGIHYDGTHNDTNESDSWGPKVEFIRRE
jgi:hypothetical protein